MVWRHAKRRVHECCPTCKCLGYCAKRKHDGVDRPGLIVLADRSFEDFKLSATNGCRFCDFLLQSFMLLQCVERDMQVEVLLHSQSPAELHSSANRAVYDAVEIYPCLEDNNRMHPNVGTDVPWNSTLEPSVHFLKENYYSCITDHHKACWQGPKLLPRRVVDISQDKYRLIEPASGTTGVYACLSYSWGSKGFAMTTSETYEALKNGFDRRILPIAFQDAAMMAQALDICYLWIDTLCIIQDSPRDWLDHARTMGDIFEGAAITIAASSIPNPDHPLFQTRNPRYREIELFSDTAGEVLDVVFKARKKIVQGFHAKLGRSTDMDPLDARAWGLQEKMLSTRLIAFTGAELQWTCRTLNACECHTNSYPSQPLFAALTDLSSTERVMKYSKIWSKIIEEYTARKLTFQEDKVPAMSGLASKFGAVTGYTPVAGLWKETIWYDLVWQIHKEPLLSSSTQLGPSFSWASAPGAVNFRLARHQYPGCRIEHTKLTDFYYNTTGHKIFNRAIDGSLTVRGPTVAARLRKSSEDFQAYMICIDDATYSPNTNQLAICEFSIDSVVPSFSLKIVSEAPQRISWGSPSSDTDQEAEEPVTLLSLYSIHHQKYLYQNFLILAKSHLDDQSYKRIGVGSGKLYRANNCQDHNPSHPDMVRPFEWLSVDFERRGRGIGNVTERVMCIR